MKKYTNIIQLGDDQVEVSVSSCSWMYSGYGLQIKGVLLSTKQQGFCKSNIFWEAVTEEVIAELSKHFHLDKCKCGNNILRGTEPSNRENLCEPCFLKKIMEEYEIELEKENKQIKLQDRKMKKTGYQYKVTAWVHAGGDDQCIDIYYWSKPGAKEIASRLKSMNSMVTDDYRIVKL